LSESQTGATTNIAGTYDLDRVRVWQCGHDNGNYLIPEEIDTYCWCGAKAITANEYYKKLEKK
jgi:hypothetical protein